MKKWKCLLVGLALVILILFVVDGISFFVKSHRKDNLIFERRIGDRTLCADEVVIGGALYKEVVKGANMNLFGGGGRHGP